MKKCKIELLKENNEPETVVQQQ